MGGAHHLKEDDGFDLDDNQNTNPKPRLHHFDEGGGLNVDDRSVVLEEALRPRVHLMFDIDQGLKMASVKVEVEMQAETSKGGRVIPPVRLVVAMG